MYAEVISIYDVVEATSVHHLKQQMEKKLADGYQPWGNVFIPENGYLCQAVVKYDFNKKSEKLNAAPAGVVN